MPRLQLPIDEFVPEILSKLSQTPFLVITAAPGAGKTTRVPPALIKISQLKVAVLEPRRIAAAAAASRIAEENNWNLGDEVGFEVRFDRQISSKTKLHFLTEALLLRKMATDRSLSEFDIVVLDEFHERSLNTDVAIGLLKELQMLERPDLKVVVMSATLDAKKISEFLDNCPIIDVPGKLFPITTVYDSKPQALSWNHDITQRILEKIKVAIQKTHKDCLVFLPGLYEINQCLNASQHITFFDDFIKLPLHGKLNLVDQKKALLPASSRKIIFATNVAESSLTIDGLDCVVDSGLERVSVYQPNSGFQKLSTKRISRASATQRAGRSGRQFPGHCFKLWSQQDELSFGEFSMPEIKTQDLSETLLFLNYIGIKDIHSFSWFEKPTEAQIKSSVDKLMKLNLINQKGITELGKRVQKNPIGIRDSILLESFKDSKIEALGAWVVALLAEKNIQLPRSEDFLECDLASLLSQTSITSQDRIRKLANHLSPQARNWKWDDSQVALLKNNLIKSFADHLGRRRSSLSSRGVLANGRGINISPESHVKKSPYFVALQASDNESSNETQVYWASGVTEDDLLNNFSQDFQTDEKVVWDEEKKEFFLKSVRSLWGLEIGLPTYKRADRNHIERHLPEVALQNFEWLKKNSDNFSNWWSRYLFFINKVKKTEDSEVEKKILREACEMACLGQRSLDDLLKVNWESILDNCLSLQDRKELNQKVPTFLRAAQDRQVKVHYEGENAPFVEIKIQHAFVWDQTPRVGNDQPLTVVLLAPNMRPTQVTKDLEGFWSGSYSEVRKELKARYPKHDWPEPRTKK
ncbi:MAG: ATP-dependent helicase HrpB [Bdellovibrionales bacterium]